MIDQTIMKNAGLADDASGFVDGFFSTVSNKLDLKHKPFELLFGTIVPSATMSIFPMLGVLFYLGEFAGYGPGLIGAQIDKALGLREGEIPNVSDENLQKTSQNIVDNVSDKVSLDSFTSWIQEKTKPLFGMTSESMLKEIQIIKGSVSSNDIFVANVFSATQSGVIKNAGIKDLFNFFKQTTRGKKLTLGAVLYWILKRFVKGLIGLGLVGGAIGLAKEVGTKEAPAGTTETKTPLPKYLDLGGTQQTYQNTKKNVENTIIDFLNSEYFFKDKSGQKKLTFSEKFKEIYGSDMKESQQMQKLLETIQFINGNASLDYISSWRVFAAPDILTMAGVFLPGITVKSPTGTSQQVVKNVSEKEKAKQRLKELFERS